MARDPFEKVQSFTKAAEYRRAGLYPYFPEFSGSAGESASAMIHGREVLMFGSNNYLGLANHPEVREAAKTAIDEYGTGCSGSRMLNGTRDLHVRLEQALAAFLGREAAVVFGTGFQTNVGVLSALVQRDDVILMDRNNHASLLDGALLSFGRTVRFRHGDAEDLKGALQHQVPDNAGALVVVDGVFSMEGDVSDLPSIAALARQYGARTYVDESHALGVLGAHGRGSAELLGVERDVDILMSTFSKSLGSIGGFVSGPAPVIDYIRHHSRSFVYSASLAPPNAAAALKALEILQAEPHRRQRLLETAATIRRSLTELGLKVLPGFTPIVPIVMDDEASTCRLFWALMDAGIYTNPVLVPAVSSNLLRISCMAIHTEEHVDRLVTTMRSLVSSQGVAVQTAG